jgi:hypothetical protein
VTQRSPPATQRAYPLVHSRHGHGLELGTALVPLAVVGAGCLGLAGFIAYIRLRGPRLVDCHEVTVVSESPVTAIDRIEHAVRDQEHYSYRRIGLEQLEIVRSDAEPDEHAEKPLPRARRRDPRPPARQREPCGRPNRGRTPRPGRAPRAPRDQVGARPGAALTQACQPRATSRRASAIDDPETGFAKL